jgi:hypothetical protein
MLLLITMTSSFDYCPHPLIFVNKLVYVVPVCSYFDYKALGDCLWASNWKSKGSLRKSHKYWHRWLLLLGHAIPWFMAALRFVIFLIWVKMLPRCRYMYLHTTQVSTQVYFWTIFAVFQNHFRSHWIHGRIEKLSIRKTRWYVTGQKMKRNFFSTTAKAKKIKSGKFFFVYMHAVKFRTVSLKFCH